MVYRKTPYRKGESAMSEALKERKEMDPQYQWDLTKMYASDAEWEKAFAAIDPKIEALAAWEGKLNNAASIREFYDAEIGVFRELENLAVYTSLRLSEDTRADAPRGGTQSAFPRQCGVDALLSHVELVYEGAWGCHLHQLGVCQPHHHYHCRMVDT